jgi:mono/diheme cytochrome c family protein
MKKPTFQIFALIGISFILFNTSCTNKQQSAKEETEVADTKPEDVIKHGEYLVTIMGCNDCHSPKQMGAQGPEVISELMLSGYPADRPVVKFTDPMLKEGFGMFYPDLTAAAGPWGVSFAANITPDETGIGNWSEEQFKKALTEGKYKGLEEGRMLLPPMPWFNYKSMADTDVNAIYTYLMSINPVSNVVPSPVSPNQM